MDKYHEFMRGVVELAKAHGINSIRVQFGLPCDSANSHGEIIADWSQLRPDIRTQIRIEIRRVDRVDVP